MNEMIAETMKFIASYIGIIVFFFFGINWLSKGWLSTFLKVKASRGKKSIVICHGVLDTYFRVGTLESGAFKFKDRDGQHQAFTSVTREDIIHIFGVTGLEVDIPSSSIINRGESSPGCSAEETDNYIKKVIEAPQVDDKYKKILIGLLVVILIAVIVGLALNFQLLELVKGLKISGVIQ